MEQKILLGKRRTNIAETVKNSNFRAVNVMQDELFCLLWIFIRFSGEPMSRLKEVEKFCEISEGESMAKKMHIAGEIC